MARPIKTGLDYSPQQTDIHSNRKIKRLIAEFGAKGYLIYDYIKAQCFKENGYWIQYDDNFCFDVSDTLKAGITEELVSEVITGCIRLCLFNEGVWNMSRIITSSGIQKRYYEAKRNPVINSKIWVIDAKTIVNAAITIQNNTESAQSKVKESKEEKSKENGYADTQPPAPDGNVYANIEGFKNNFLNDMFCVSTIVAKGVEASRIQAWLDAFNRRLIFTKDTLKSERDYRSHFANWLVKIPNYRNINPDGYDAVKDVPLQMELPRKVVVEHNGGEVIWPEEKWKQYCNNPAASGYTFIRYEL